MKMNSRARDERMRGETQGSHSLSGQMDISETGEDALGLFNSEQSVTPAENPAVAEASSIDLFRSEPEDPFSDILIVPVRPTVVPLVPEVVEYAASSASDAGAAPEVESSPRRVEPARWTRFWAFAALLSAAALAVVVFSLGYRSSDPAESTLRVATVTAEPSVVAPAEPPITNAPPKPLPRADAFSAPATPTLRAPSGPASSAQSLSPEIERPRPAQPSPPVSTTARSGVANPAGPVAAAPAAASPPPPSSPDQETAVLVPAVPRVETPLPSSPSPPAAPPAIAPPAPIAPPDRGSAPRPEATSATPSPATAGPQSAPAGVASDIGATQIAAIQSVIGRYINAFITLDIEEAKAVWPRVNERALSRAFASVDEQQLEMNECGINVAGSNADASCTGIVRYVPKVGTKTMRVLRRQWKFELRNSGNQWFIENVDVR